ncbi:MAG: IS110 family transposase [Candidatus Neomarinimicrobiota bacterium]
MKVFVGIDVSKDKFNYAFVDENDGLLGQSKAEMNRGGFTQFWKACQSFEEAFFAMESTGSYHVNLLSFLLSNTEHVFLLNPCLVKKHQESNSLRKTKTDTTDAVAIARFLKEKGNDLHQTVPQQVQSLISLARLRENIAEEVAKTKTQIKQKLNITFPEFLVYNVFTNFALEMISHYPSAKSIRNTKTEKFIATLQPLLDKVGRPAKYSLEQVYQLAQESIGTADPNLESVVLFHIRHLKFLTENLDVVTDHFTKECDKTFGDQISIMTSVSGIGKITTGHFLTEISSIDRFKTAKQMIAFCGTDPSIKQSGKMSIHGKVTKRGSKSLRRTGFLMATSVPKLRDPVFRDYYQKKRNEGMPYRKAVIATWNKLARVIFAMLKGNLLYNPDCARTGIIYS